MELLYSLVIGITLSATSGFRVFVPLLVLSLAARFDLVTLAPSFAWIAADVALVAFAVATVMEVAAYFFPVVDNFLGAISAPVSILAGTIISASMLVDMPPLLTWVLALVAGGGSALGGSTVSNAVHGISTISTGGAANPFLSLVESFLALVASILAVLVPILAFLLLLCLTFITFLLVRKLGARRKGLHYT